MAWLTADVEAENLYSAIAAAYKVIPSGICAQCSGWGQAWTVDLAEWYLTDEPINLEGFPSVEKIEDDV